MSKIVYLIEQPLDQRNYDRFGIQTWIDRGWIVEVWDLTPHEHPLVWQRFIGMGGKLKHFEGYYTISSKCELEQKYSTESRIDYFVDFLGDSSCCQRVKMRLLKDGAKMVVCANIGSMPSIEGVDEIKGVRKFVRKVRKATAFGPAISIKLLGRKLLSKLTKNRIRPSLIIASGANSIRSIPYEYDQEIIKAHNLDYDDYLKLVRPSGIPSDDYGLFVDQNLCFHPEYLSANLDPYVTPGKYFPALRSGLRRISMALGVEMQIAAHPRANYDQINVDCFEELPIRKGATAELVCRSKFVVGHYSTALQMAVLFGKPIIFVTTNELRSSIFGRQFERMASILGKTTINLDDDLDRVDWEKELAIDSEKYNKYRKEYIKTDGTPELSSWDIVINHIERSSKKSLALDEYSQSIGPSSLDSETAVGLASNKK